MVRVVSKTVVKKSRDEALEHVKLALRTNSNLFTRQEMSFIRTSCHILGIDGNAMAKAVMNEVKDNGIKQPRKVMEYLQSRLKELAERVEKHKRPTPNPAASTRAANSMGTPARSLGNLVGCAEALKEAIKGQYSKGIRAAIKAMENAKSDYKATIDRMAEACRWKAETTNGWINKGELACGNLMEGAEAALKEAEEKEEAEVKSGLWRVRVRSWRAWQHRPGSKYLPRPKSRYWRSWKRKWTTGRRWWETWVGS
jgi:hypothetical protein